MLDPGHTVQKGKNSSEGKKMLDPGHSFLALASYSAVIKSIGIEVFYCGRHPQDRGNEKKANVGESRVKGNCVSNSDSKGDTLQHKIHDHNRHW